MIVVIVPALNEEKAVSKVISDFKREGFKDVYVIDGGSSDKTVELSKKAGAKVILQNGKGKGDALRQVLREVDADIYVTVDADDTYDASRVKELVEPVKSGEYDMVVARRSLSEIPLFNRFGNFLFNMIISVFYGYRLCDILSGYRVMSRELVRSFRLDSDDFEVETELTVEALENRFKILEIPTVYKPRIGDTKLNPVRDGFRIGMTLVRLVRDYKPLKVFFGISFVCLFFGFVFGLRVVLDVLATGQMHYVGSTILSVLFIIASIQFFSVGLLADMISRRLRKMERR